MFACAAVHVTSKIVDIKDSPNSNIIYDSIESIMSIEISKCFFVLFCGRRDTVQYHGGLPSRELGQAHMLQVFLTPRQALSSHLRQQMV